MASTAVVTPSGSQTVALAYAVAALQNGAGAVVDSGLQIPQSLMSNLSDQVSSVTGEQCAGSCTNENESPDHGDDEDASKRLARSRERNREHARRTRLRKKAQLEALQSKVKGLEAERQVLKQNIEDCSIASILLGLSNREEDSSTRALLDSAPVTGVDAKSDKVALLSSKRKRFISEAVETQPQPLTISINGELTVIGGGKSHINWKTGVYTDDSGAQRQLSPDELESLRRERNRMHAKMTRDRKKSFIATIEKTIEDLEAENERMRGILSKVSSNRVTPMTSPALSSVAGPEDDLSVYSSGDDEPPAKRRAVPHGFSLND